MFQKKEVESENWRHENMIYKPSVGVIWAYLMFMQIEWRGRKKKRSAVHLVKFLFLVVLAGLHFKAQTLTKGVDISRAAFYKVTFNFKMRTHTLNM